METLPFTFKYLQKNVLFPRPRSARRIDPGALNNETNSLQQTLLSCTFEKILEIIFVLLNIKCRKKKKNYAKKIKIKSF